MRRILLLLGLCWMSLSVSVAQRVVTVSGEYVYHAPENVTPEQARFTALERAKIQALADEFGTTISKSDIIDVRNGGDGSSVDFFSLGESEVRGEWIETIGEPEYDVMYDKGMLVVTVRVKGKAREIKSAPIDLSVKVLRNGTTDRFESTSFRNGDDIFLSFSSPVKGFLAVYLVDAEQRANCLLPYAGQEDGIYFVKANQPYIFFKVSEAEPLVRAVAEEYVLNTTVPVEYNRLYVIFSPKEFVKANDHSGSSALMPRELSFKDFQRWLTRCRKHDERMTTRMIPITIRRE